MKDLEQITVIGLGLLGGSVALAISHRIEGVKAVGYSHRASTRDKARELTVADEVFDDMIESVKNADIVILATPICTFEKLFAEIGPHLKDGCIVTEVGSTKTLPHKWAKKALPKSVHYVGSHPIAGSEQSGVDYCRDDLLYNALCIVTSDKQTDAKAAEKVRQMWSALGCRIKNLSPAEHDRIYADVSHLPHVLAATLVNSVKPQHLEFAGKGFMDSSRIASGPANIWGDIILTNPNNIIKGISRTITQLNKISDAIEAGDRKQIEKLLNSAREKRAEMINHKVSEKEILP